MTDCFRRRWQQTLGSGCALLLLTPALAPAERTCLRVENDERSIATFSIHRGDNFFLSFAHSIYGSIVEEQFLVIGNHLRLLRARYEELRLVEFYGHEHAHFQDGWWVVEAKPREIPSLELRVSQDSRFKLSWGGQQFFLVANRDAGFFRLRIGSCAE